ncbi:hypothetical protein Tco_1287576 [Tanacetum coccineum]
MPIDKESPPAIVLEDDCLNTKDLTLSLMGRVKVTASLVNLKKALCNEGFDVVKISYLGELWIGLGGIGRCIAAKWGELLDVDDYDESNLPSKRICILSKFTQMVYSVYDIGNVRFVE